MSEVLNAIKSWRGLNAVLKNLNEQEVLELLNAEDVGERRGTVLERLHQRYTMLRAVRERDELMRGVTK